MFRFHCGWNLFLHLRAQMLSSERSKWHFSVNLSAQMLSFEHSDACTIQFFFGCPALPRLFTGHKQALNLSSAEFPGWASNNCSSERSYALIWALRWHSGKPWLLLMGHIHAGDYCMTSLHSIASQEPENGRLGGPSWIKMCAMSHVTWLPWETCDLTRTLLKSKYSLFVHNL